MADYGSAAKEGLVDGLQSAAEISLWTNDNGRNDNGHQ